MKLENKRTTIIKEKKVVDEKEEITYMNYGDVIKLFCEATAVPKTIKEQRMIFQIIDAVETANGEIDLQDDWVPIIKSMFETIAVYPVNRDYIKLEDDIDNAK